jgi:AcrR family transcriptional regulator
MPPKTQTRDRVLRAAVKTLAEQGFAATTARAIAATGGFAPGVIYYHFEDLEDLLVATMRYTSEERIARYTERTAAVGGFAELVETLRELYAEDADTGHIAAVQEMVAGAKGSPKLAGEERPHARRLLLTGPGALPNPRPVQRRLHSVAVTLRLMRTLTDRANNA